MNMTYCRFENTLEALRDCRDALGESCDPLASLSDSERLAAAKLLELCKELVTDYT
jgi:hypothetical protein